MPSKVLGTAWKFTGRRTYGQIIFTREDRGLFAIRDNGVGFNMDGSERLFEAFGLWHRARDRTPRCRAPLRPGVGTW